MSRTCLIGLALGLASSAGAQSIDVRVDPRVELFSTLFRMAGRDEYSRSRVPRWIAAMDSQFAPFAAHPAVRTTEWLAKQNRVGFFVPMNLAVHLSAPPALAERAPFASTPSVHRAWTTMPDSTRAYVDRVRALAVEAKFADFMRAQSTLVDSTQTRLRRLIDTNVDRSWFNAFWGGAPKIGFVLVAALTNGGASYGQEFSPAGGSAEAYAIIGVMRVDAAGLPTFDTSMVSTAIHEMNHPYVTPLLREHIDAFRPFADSLYAPVARLMRSQAYGSWDATLNESLVRAAVIRYQLAHGGITAAEPTIVEETKLGFVWTRALVDLLGEYERDRTRYPAMSDFMPRIVTFFRDFAPRVRGLAPSA